MAEMCKCRCGWNETSPDEQSQGFVCLICAGMSEVSHGKGSRLDYRRQWCMVDATPAAFERISTDSCNTWIAGGIRVKEVIKLVWVRCSTLSERSLYLQGAS